MFAWATGMARVDGPVRCDRRHGEAGLLPQFVDQGFEAFHLPVSGRFRLEVTYQADADAGHVELFAGQMAALNLPFPTFADINFSVAHAVAVPNQEVIGHAILHVALLAMKTVNATRGC